MNLREKLGKLFHFDTSKAASSSAVPSLPALSECVDSDNKLQPFSAYRSQSQVKPKKFSHGKQGSYPGKRMISASGAYTRHDIGEAQRIHTGNTLSDPWQ